MTTEEYYEEKMEMPLTELIDEMFILESRLRDAVDLLNDCGYFFENGRWVDSENPEEEE